jgi:hypothetical protein
MHGSLSCYLLTALFNWADAVIVKLRGSKKDDRPSALTGQERNMACRNSFSVSIGLHMLFPFDRSIVAMLASYKGPIGEF